MVLSLRAAKVTYSMVRKTVVEELSPTHRMQTLPLLGFSHSQRMVIIPEPQSSESRNTSRVSLLVPTGTGLATQEALVSRLRTHFPKRDSQQWLIL